MHKKIQLFIYLCFGTILILQAQYTSIPDSQFEASLSSYDDIPGDGQVPTARIQTVTRLDVADEGINDLTGIEDFTALVELDAYENFFSEIDLSSNTALEILDLSNLPLTELDLSTLTALRELTLVNNSLTSLDLKANTNLTSLISTGNSIESYDLRNNTLLEVLVISSSSTKYINVQNGNNTNITSHAIYGNTDLCVAVDDLAYSQANWNNAQSTNIYSAGVCPLYTAILDTNFEAALGALGYDDVSGDGQVPTALIENVEVLNVSFQNIADLTGIEDFTALTDITAIDNNLITVDLSGNTKLTDINFSRNDLATIDISMLTDLEFLDVSSNNLANLDVSTNILLTELRCDNNNLTNLDISGLGNLETLYCYRNSNLSNLAVTGATNLETILAFNCNFNSVDLSNMPNLSRIQINSNNLTQIDFSNTSSLTSVYINDNDLTSVDLRNGNNQNINNFDARGNSDLTCIAVDDIAYALSEFEIDTQTIFTTDCDTYSYIPDTNFENALYILGLDDIQNDNQVPTTNIESLLSLDVSNSNINDLTGIEYFTSLTSLIANNNNITTVDLSNNTTLTAVDFQNNALGVLNVSLLANLVSLDASNNQLFSLNIQNGNNTNFTNFDATGNTDLTCVLVDDDSDVPAVFSNNVDVQTLFNDADCTMYTAIPDANFEGILWDLGYDDIDGDGQVPKDLIYGITSLTINGKSIADLTGIEDFVLLERLDCYSNNIISLDVSKNTNLRYLGVYNNELTSLDLSANVALEEIYCQSNDLTSLDISGLTNLIRLDCDSNELNNLNIRSNIALEYIDFGNNDFTAIDISNNVNLVELRGYDNSLLTTLDLTNNISLEKINLNDCQFTDIDLSANTQLLELDLSRNFFSSIDLTNNTLLTELDLEDNGLNTIDLSKNTALVEVDMGENNFTSLHFPDNNNLTDINVEENSLLTTITFGSLPNLEEIITDDCIISTIDVSGLTSLKKLDIRDNQLTYLDLSENKALTSIFVNRNELTYLNMQNGMNRDVFTFNASNNDDLVCIVVDDATYSAANWLSVDAGITFSTTTCGHVQIPDANFEAALEALGYDDITGDGQVPVSLIENVTTLDVQGENISDLTGIKAFVALQDLNIAGNSIVDLDISNMSNLQLLDAQAGITTSLDASNTPNLETIHAYESNISSINLTGATALKELNVYRTNIKGLDVTESILLEKIQAFEMPSLKTINLTGLIALKELQLFRNDVEILDLSTNTALEIVVVYETSLRSLNLKNGTNTQVTTFNAINNSDLGCILVDDAAYSTTNWTAIDAQTSFNEISCIPDSTPPVITLLGSDPVTVEIGSTYTDAGATAMDDIDGDITTDIIVLNPVDINVIGEYTITYNVTDAAGNPATKVTRTVKVIESCPILNLPANNFVVQTYSETCTDKNNGTILIDAVENLNYTTTINGEKYTFTTNLIVNDLAPGVYPVCIAIEGYSNCEQCFELAIQDAPVLSGKTTVNTDNNSSKVFVEINSGTAPYTVSINNQEIKEFTTNSFYVDVQHGDTVEVFSSATCQGKLSTTVDLYNTMYVYPNPTQGDIEISNPGATSTVISVVVFNALGVQLSSQQYDVIDGKVLLSMSDLPSGIYFVQANDKTFRIVKQ